MFSWPGCESPMHKVMEMVVKSHLKWKNPTFPNHPLGKALTEQVRKSTQRRDSRTKINPTLIAILGRGFCTRPKAAKQQHQHTYRSGINSAWTPLGCQTRHLPLPELFGHPTAFKTTPVPTLLGSPCCFLLSILLHWQHCAKQAPVSPSPSQPTSRRCRQRQPHPGLGTILLWRN